LTAIEFELTAEDFAAFNVRYAATSEVIARQAFYSRIALSAAVLVLLVLFFGIAYGDFVEGLVAGAVGALLMWLIFPRSWRRSMERHMSAGDGLGTPGTYVLTVDDEGLHETGPGVAMSATWASIVRTDLAPSHLFIYYAPQAAIVVPLSVGNERIDQLLREIEEHRPRA
jgi:hypothetical protein